MKRRTFLRTMTASGAALSAAPWLKCSSSPGYERIMPHGKMPEKLWALSLDYKTDWQTKNLTTCFQGLINRNNTRVYIVYHKQDQFWLDYYRDEYNIGYEKVDSIKDLFKLFAQEISGTVLYDNAHPHSLNLATTYGALNNLLPVTREQLALAQEFGLEQKADMSDKAPDHLTAYEWARKELLPKCNKKVVAQLCIHVPHFPISTFTNRDYVMAHNIFSFDMSTSERDKADYNLIKKIYQEYPEEAYVIGWHCARDKEHEAIALSSEYGIYGMCNLNTTNMSVHSSMPVPDHNFKQRPLDKKNLKVENKVYIAYMTTDGDAAWFVENHVVKDWADPTRGKIKYNWGFMPLAYDFMPALVKYYFENLEPMDYFIAASSGATYTYPHLHPDPKKFLKLTNDYMKKCGITEVHMANWNDRDWWQEAVVPGFYETQCETMPDVQGFMRGMGESAFEKHFIGKGKPDIFFGEGIHRGDDVYKVFKEFIDACPNRPLFINCIGNHSVSMSKIKEAMDRFPADKVELVHMDEFMYLIDKAYAEGKITQDLYPQKDKLKDMLSNDAKAKWPNFHKELKALKSQYKNGETSYIKSLKDTLYGLEKSPAADILAFITIWNGMTLNKLALESQKIYVNHKPTATKQFVKKFSNIQDVKLATELQALWDNWHQENFTFQQAVKLADRLLALTERIDKQYF